MTWKDDIKKSDRNFISNRLDDSQRQFMDELYQELDDVVDTIKQEFDNYPEYDRDKIEKVILHTLKEEIRGIKMNLKYSQKLLFDVRHQDRDKGQY